jgi:hypothetical protein
MDSLVYSPLLTKGLAPFWLNPPSILNRQKENEKKKYEDGKNKFK